MFIIVYENIENVVYMRANKELKVIRELLSLTQEDLALNIRVSLDTISRWEK